jgi:hypothetical protein
MVGKKLLISFGMGFLAFVVVGAWALVTLGHTSDPISNGMAPLFQWGFSIAAGLVGLVVSLVFLFLKKS